VTRNALFMGALGLAVLVGTVVVCGGGEVCLEPAPAGAWGCCPCDLEIEMDWVGYDATHSQCSSLPEVPWSLDHYRYLYPEREHGWWRGLWTLSTSTIDPFEVRTQSSLETSLYLWLVDAGCGYGFSGGGVVVHSDLPVVSYDPLSSGSHRWTLAPDSLGGSLWVDFPCRTPCGPGQFWDPPRVIGLFRFARVRRREAPFESTDTVRAAPWSEVKGQFR
jgi:hypothetical protein